MARRCPRPRRALRSEPHRPAGRDGLGWRGGAGPEGGGIRGPRLQISVTALAQTGGHVDGWTPSANWVDPYYLPHPSRPVSVVDGPTRVRKAIRESIRAGADFIKVLATHGMAGIQGVHFSPEERDAIREETAAANKPLVAHAYGPAGVRASVEMGARSIEHGGELDRET